jgi:hypothetical protein
MGTQLRVRTRTANERKRAALEGSRAAGARTPIGEGERFAVPAVIVDQTVIETMEAEGKDWKFELADSMLALPLVVGVDHDAILDTEVLTNLPDNSVNQLAIEIKTKSKRITAPPE